MFIQRAVQFTVSEQDFSKFLYGNAVSLKHHLTGHVSISQFVIDVASRANKQFIVNFSIPNKLHVCLKQNSNQHLFSRVI